MTSQLATQISGGKLADPHLDRVIVTLKSSWIARYNFSCLWVERFPHSPSNQVFFKRHFSKTNKVHSKSPPPFFLMLLYIFVSGSRIDQTSHQKPRGSLVRLVVEAKSIFSGKSGKMFWSVLRPSGWKNLENSRAFGSPKLHGALDGRWCSLSVCWVIFRFRLLTNYTPKD